MGKCGFEACGGFLLLARIYLVSAVLSGRYQIYIESLLVDIAPIRTEIYNHQWMRGLGGSVKGCCHVAHYCFVCGHGGIAGPFHIILSPEELNSRELILAACKKAIIGEIHVPFSARRRGLHVSKRPQKSKKSELRQ